jgi:Abnormal spindle-like microcephaly-assoc'd, ASPM-SPD-2-Hydin
MLGLLVVAPALVSLQVCGPRITFSPTNLSFTPQVVDPNGAPSPAQVITVRNSGNRPGLVGSIIAVGPYAQTNHCPATLNPNTSCTIDVSFVPNAVGSLNGAVRGVVLTATGLAPVGFNPSVLDFGTVDIGQTSAQQAVTLTNNQGAALAINSITASGNYSQANNCPTSLAAGATCTLNVSFVPTVKGTVAGALSVVTDAALAAQPVGLTGIGSGTATPSVSFTPTSLDFGNLEAGTESTVKTLTLKNTSGSASLTVTSVAASAGYASTDTCAGKLLPAGGTCTISVKFQPTANLVPVAYPGAITVVDSDPTATQVIALAGFGVAPVSPSPTSLDVGVVFYRSSSGSSTVTLTNSDAAAETPTLTGTGGVSLANNTCTGSLAPGGKCTIDVTLGPSSAGPAHGAMAIDFSSGGFLSPQVLSVSGCRTEVARTPESLNFGAVSVGSTGDTETVTIGGGAFNFSGFTLSGANAAEFAIANNTCGNTLSSGTCSVDLTFTPTAAGVRTATLELADDQHCSPQPVNLAIQPGSIVVARERLVRQVSLPAQAL